MNTDTITPLTPRLVAENLQEMGYQGKLHFCESYCYVQTAANGLTLFIYFIHPNGNLAVKEDDVCGAVRFCGGWDRLSRFDARRLTDLLDWFNREHRFCKVYRSDHGDGPCLRVEAEWMTLDGISVRSFHRMAHCFFDLYQVLRNRLDELPSIASETIRQRHNEAVRCAHGPAADEAHAIELYRANADVGYAGSQNNLGDLYERGKGVTQNLAYAVYWYTRAAERGEPTAYLSLAEILYVAGRNGDTAIWLDAGKYALLASAYLPEGHNKSTAQRIVEKLETLLPEDAWACAVELAKTFSPLFQETAILSDTPTLPASSEGLSIGLH